MSCLQRVQGEFFSLSINEYFASHIVWHWEDFNSEGNDSKGWWFFFKFSRTRAVSTIILVYFARYLAICISLITSDFYFISYPSPDLCGWHFSCSYCAVLVVFVANVGTVGNNLSKGGWSYHWIWSLVQRVNHLLAFNMLADQIIWSRAFIAWFGHFSMVAIWWPLLQSVPCLVGMPIGWRWPIKEPSKFLM